ncbi:MAG TPA: hypothetical protein VNZ49_02375 [Bacteroidia bacterium]|jgi:hypothetical protein|nr:hypothetical protein [Bacteroidia bacterium]
MCKNLKINIALLLCTMFVFRVLFVNISLLSSSDTPQTKSLLAKHFRTIQKRRRHIQANVIDYTAVEICEEVSDNEEELKRAGSPVILSILYSFLKRVTFILKSIRPFDLIKCDLYPRKYLSLSNLRI